jgi:anthranilate/para-aminobenzoate synthase component II
MQVIASVMGAQVAPSRHPVHGKTSLVSHDGHGLFAGVSHPFAAARYHSLQVVAGSVPQNLEITAWCADGTIMGCRVPEQSLEGVLFHPESFLTEHGSRIVSNFLRN